MAPRGKVGEGCRALIYYISAARGESRMGSSSKKLYMGHHLRWADAMHVQLQYKRPAFQPKERPCILRVQAPGKEVDEAAPTNTVQQG